MSIADFEEYTQSELMDSVFPHLGIRHEYELNKEYPNSVLARVLFNYHTPATNYTYLNA